MILFTTLVLMALKTNSPFFLTLTVLLSASVASVTAGLQLSKWMFVALVMVFLGGMMILFFYVLSLNKQKKITEIPLKSAYPIPTIMILSFMEFFFFQTPYNNPMSHMYTPFSSDLILGLAILLFMCLLVTVLLANLNKGSLTKKF